MEIFQPAIRSRQRRHCSFFLNKLRSLSALHVRNCWLVWSDLIDGSVNQCHSAGPTGRFVCRSSGEELTKDRGIETQRSERIKDYGVRPLSSRSDWIIDDSSNCLFASLLFSSFPPTSTKTHRWSTCCAQLSSLFNDSVILLANSLSPTPFQRQRLHCHRVSK
jgi:hypothetical protein